MADTCSNLTKIERLREDLLGRDPLHASPQQGSERLPFVDDLDQRPEGVKADGSDFAHGSARLLMI
jgi:hypothetical protein